MLKIKTIVGGVALAVAAATVAVADADRFAKYGEVEGWKVYLDNEKGTCLLESIDANGNVVQMGITKAGDMGYFGVFSKSDTELKNREQRKINIDIDGELYTSVAKGVTKGITPGYSGGYILANNPNFINDLAKKYIMTVNPGEADEFKVDLKGTFKAMNMTKECNAAQS